MSDVALQPTPAQERMAAARAARTAKREAVQAEMSESVLAPDVVAMAKAQREEREAAELAALQAEAKKVLNTPGAFGPSRQERAAAIAAQEQIERENAARRAVVGSVEDVVTVRVTKIGHNKVSRGQHAAGIGDAHYQWKEEFTLSRSVAEQLEARGLVEID